MNLARVATAALVSLSVGIPSRNSQPLIIRLGICLTDASEEDTLVASYQIGAISDNVAQTMRAECKE
jgi:hypothetical protein